MIRHRLKSVSEIGKLWTGITRQMTPCCVAPNTSSSFSCIFSNLSRKVFEVLTLEVLALLQNMSQQNVLLVLKVLQNVDLKMLKC